MGKIYILDSTTSDNVSSFRGGGRIMQLLKENLPEEKFINSGVALLSRMTLKITPLIIILAFCP